MCHVTLRPILHSALGLRFGKVCDQKRGNYRGDYSAGDPVSMAH